MSNYKITTKLFADSQDQADSVANSMDFLCDKCVPKTEIASIVAFPASGQLTVATNQNVTFNVSVKLKNTESGVLQVEVYKGNSLITKSFRDVAGSPDALENFTISFQAPDAAGAYDYKILARFKEGVSGELISDDFCEVRHQITYNINVEKITIGKRVGLQAGHWQYDSGAIGCDGQTREVDINLEVANKAAEILRQRGYTVEVLPSANAPNSPIPSYTADAFVALHTDYCAGENSGFKVSRYGGAKGTGKLGNGDASDQLVDYLWSAYGVATSLSRDTSTGHFTDDMIYYNALDLIAKSTPGAIIEMGWLSGDFAFMTSIEGQQKMATGIANSVDQFLNQAFNPPTELTQLKSNGKTQINIGSATNEGTVVFSARVSDPDGDKVRLQVELRRTDEYGGGFDETKGGLKEGDLVTSGNVATASAIELIDGNYHWRARAVDEKGNKGEWKEFGDNSTLDADFIVSISSPTRFKFVQLTDLHIGSDPDCYDKYDIWRPITNNDVEKCLFDKKVKSYNLMKLVKNDILSNISPDFVIITGDSVEWNKVEHYKELNRILEDFEKKSVKVYIVSGNHDIRGMEDPKRILDTFNGLDLLVFGDTLSFLPKIGAVIPNPNPLFDNLISNKIIQPYVNNYEKYEGSRDSKLIKEGYKIIGIDSGADSLSDSLTKCMSYNFPKYCGKDIIDWIASGPESTGLENPQIEFLKNNVDDKTIIFMHNPAIDCIGPIDICGGPSAPIKNEYWNSRNVLSQNRQEFIKLLKSKHVPLVLTGHTHASKSYINLGLDICGPEGMICENDKDASSFFNRGYPIHLDSPLFLQTRSATKGTGGNGYLIVSVKDNGDIQLEDRKVLDNNPVNTLILHSPADLHIYDDLGRHTGLDINGGIENNIPDSDYFEEDKMLNITLPAFVLLYNTTLNYTYEIRSNFSRENITSDQCTFNFTIEQKKQNATLTILYNNVLINNNSKAWLNTNQTDYAMQIDLNNDSEIDTMKMPDSIIIDYAPMATIQSPANGSVWDQGQPIAFNGEGFDKEDGSLTELTWISDTDDVIGHGNFTTSNLSAGVHNIFLQVNDSKGQVNSSNITIFVNDTRPPFLIIEYPKENKIFNKANISVSGLAFDDSGISNVTARGIQAGKESWNKILVLNEGENIIEVVATDNYGFTTTAQRTVYYNSSLASDIQPPAAITKLTHKTGYDEVSGAWINWTWDNPKDQDFSYAIIYLDDIQMVNTSKSYINFTGLSSDADYNVSILTADIVDNINNSEVKDTARTPSPDTAPPQSITNPSLQAAGTTWLNFTWLNPPCPDFHHVMLYLNGTFKTSILAPQNYYNFTGLEPDTLYELGTHTVDTSGNLNETWKNATAQTLPLSDTTPPAIMTDLHNITYAQTYINWTWIDPIDDDFANVSIWIDSVFKVNIPKGMQFYNATDFAPDTEHTISTKTIDTNGNINQTWVNRTARTAPLPDTTPPTITFVLPTPDNNSEISVNYVNISINLSELGVAHLFWNGAQEDMEGSDTGFFKNKTGLDNGVYFYYVNASDAADNVNTSETRWITVNIPAPVFNISGFKINDTNGNGLWDAGEQGIANWNISLKNATTDEEIASTSTNAEGFFQFINHANGRFNVTEKMKSGWTPTNATFKVIDIAGQDIANLNFTNKNEIPTTNITIISPNGGENWQSGIKQVIGWTYSGDPRSRVKIELLKGDVVNHIITSRTQIGRSGSGSYNWRIPSTQAPGTDYKIRVTSTSSPVDNDISNNNFTIS